MKERIFSFKMFSSSGQTLVVIMGILVVFMIFIPTLIYMVQHESKWTVKQTMTSTAFHAAEAGADRGIWKLAESSANWDLIAGSTGTIAGYNDDVVYNVYTGSTSNKLAGQYKINIFAGPGIGQVTILSKGRDHLQNEVRAIQIILSKGITNIDSAMSVDGGMSWKPNLDVHWGPIVTYGSMTGVTNYYPRKYATGQISPRDTDPTELNSDGKEYWAFQDLGDPPQIDLAYYRTIAQSCKIPTSAAGGTIRKATGGSAAVASPVGSGYFPAASNNGGIRLFGGYKFYSSTCVIYTDGTIDGQNNSFVQLKAMIAEGNVDFKGDGVTYTANVPSTAGLEYIKQKEVNPSYTYPGEGLSTYGVVNCGMHGFLYCGGNMNSAGGNSALVGSAKIIGTISFNTFTVYYDVAVSTSISVSNLNATARQVSWQEIRSSW